MSDLKRLLWFILKYSGFAMLAIISLASIGWFVRTLPNITLGLFLLYVFVISNKRLDSWNKHVVKLKMKMIDTATIPVCLFWIVFVFGQLNLYSGYEEKYVAYPFVLIFEYTRIFSQELLQTLISILIMAGYVYLVFTVNEKVRQNILKSSS